MTQFFGKYRALVVATNDPEKRGRIRVSCPIIYRESTSPWCEACVPVSYDGGGDFNHPKIEEFVWIEFEQGDPNLPIYTGGLWTIENAPDITTDQRQIEWNGCKILMSSDSIIISRGSSTITLNDGGIQLSAPRIDFN